MRPRIVRVGVQHLIRQKPGEFSIAGFPCFIHRHIARLKGQADRELQFCFDMSVVELQGASRERFSAL